ncbi:substrate-binding periplasmic protein [Hahella ganghwensis]|uniref:substrate-binding periplasmic protein n=1 Tax=Hahella ganghwensis TaxID=286420 RepID=UPI000362F14D|nr:hypothetical protein [Hahella ganghwensis]
MSLPGIIATILLLCSQTAAALSICYEEEPKYPYTLGHNALTLSKGGILIDMLRQTTEQHQLPLELHAWPWKRCLQALQYNQVDGAFALVWSKERDNIAVFPKTSEDASSPPNEEYRLWRALYPIFVIRTGQVKWDGQVITGHKLGFAAPTGYVAQQKLIASGLHIGAEVNNLETAFRLIDMERLDGYVIETAIGIHQIRELSLSERISPLPKPYMSANWYLALSHSFYNNHRELAWQIWTTLAEVRRTQGAPLMSDYLPDSDIMP